jgi:methylated-DNA-protein-cysteine methyltransferase-like protein
VTVWDIVRQIPNGQVSTYGQIAALIPPPQGVSEKDYQAWGARWVGGAMAACPDGVPWQRVINAQGKISLRPGGGHERQRQLLEAEGVLFDAREKIDLSRFDGALSFRMVGGPQPALDQIVRRYFMSSMFRWTPGSGRWVKPGSMSLTPKMSRTGKDSGEPATPSFSWGTPETFDQ